MIRRPPRSTLFPYTTLFRSEASYEHALSIGASPVEVPHEVGGGIKVALVRDPFGNVVGLIENPHLDRKSTRLNSSHANISYAVFCLKKKYNTSIAIMRLQAT